ncbi:MAG TPA: adenylate/guanylate cyclase domain-containing protein [Candidatus Bathyarchaeia archaeon]|nr:adenylate/guanylate cyclase domain-containing protein [Candidatus Bathyarchaeia archaeon]
MSHGQRRLAAIMYTDMVGYTAIGQRNESLSLSLVDEQRRMVRPILTKHNGREVKTMGDAFLVEFPSSLDAVRSAYDIQRSAREYNISVPEENRIHLRVGIHLGDVVESQGDISGDAVNVASRIEALAEDGGVCITRQVHDQVANKFELRFDRLGSKTLKNVASPVEVYKMTLPWEREQTSIVTGELDLRRVAVLPFANMSPDPNDSYFADGITEEIISTLSGVSGLQVISRTSVMGYKGSTKKVREIGAELEAGSILEGSFRKAGNKVRVTTQLIAVDNDRHVWTQSYDRNLDDVFAVQSDIAKHVSDALRVKILEPEMERIERKPTENAKAYGFYLQGRLHWNKRGEEDIRKAAQFFQQAIKEDDSFALGYVGLADCYELLAFNWQSNPLSNHAKADSMISKALELCADQAEAYATKALILLHDLNTRESEEAFLKAIEFKPSYATAHQWYSHLLMAQSRWDEAKRELEKAAELDPYSGIINLNLAEYYEARRDYEKALEFCRKAIEIDPSFGGGRIELAGIYAKLNRMDEAEQEGKKALSLLRGYPNAVLAGDMMTAYFQKDQTKMRALLPKLESHVGEQLAPSMMEIAGFHAMVGQTDKAFEWLERAYEEKDSSLLVLTRSDLLDSIREDPRYKSLIKRLGFA